MTVFLDNQRLRDGRNFVDDFARALVQSRIVVPVVSAAALERLMDHDPNVKDHALMEWVMALECFHSNTGASRVRRVLPVLFGRRGGSSDAIGDLFAEGQIEMLPETHPRETIKAVLKLLQTNGVEPRAGLTECTVRGVLDELKSLQGYCAWKAEDPSSVVAESADRIVTSLQDVLQEEPLRRPGSSGGSLSSRRIEPSPSQKRLALLMTASPPRGGDEGVPPPVNVTLPVLGGSCAGPTGKRSVKEVVDEIRAQLGIAESVPMKQVLDDALQTIGDKELEANCAALSLLAKAERILASLVGN